MTRRRAGFLPRPTARGLLGRDRAAFARQIGHARATTRQSSRNNKAMIAQGPGGRAGSRCAGSTQQGPRRDNRAPLRARSVVSARFSRVCQVLAVQLRGVDGLRTHRAKVGPRQNTQDAHDTHRFLPSNYAGSTEHLYTWNDMNEPSVFNGPEASTAPPQHTLCVCERHERALRLQRPRGIPPPTHTYARAHAEGARSRALSVFNGPEASRHARAHTQCECV